MNDTEYASLNVFQRHEENMKKNALLLKERKITTTAQQDFNFDFQDENNEFKLEATDGTDDKTKLAQPFLSKTDLIRLCILNLQKTDPQVKFTFRDMYNSLGGLIDHPTMSALMNRMYSTHELSSSSKDKDGCLIYVGKAIKAVPAWLALMTIEEAIQAYQQRTHIASERENDYNFQCCDDLKNYMHAGFESLLERAKGCPVHIHNSIIL